MKVSLPLVLIISLTSFCYEDVPTYLNYKLEPGAVKWDYIFEVDSTLKDRLTKMVVSSLSSKSGIKVSGDFQGVISGSLDELNVNFKDFGCSWIDTWYLLHYPLSGKFSVFIKDEKFRVIISDVHSRQPVSPYIQFSLNDCLKRNGKMRTAPTYQRSMECLEKFFIKTFNVISVKINDDW
jgi:hypothetical protein